MTALRRIAVTGGPGAGKTSVWRELVSLSDPRVAGVPEVATALFQHVFPTVQSSEERRAVQRAIFAVQRNLESIHESRLAPGQVLVCDRGVPDGAGYWPEGPAAFFAAMGTDWHSELERYEAVLFLETAAAGGLSIADGNPIRTETTSAAVGIDLQLRQVWERHPNCHFVPHARDFADKLAAGRNLLLSWLARQPP
jgi:predicted ATPase